jgi:hypothetical protein
MPAGCGGFVFGVSLLEHQGAAAALQPAPEYGAIGSGSVYNIEAERIAIECEGAVDVPYEQ